MSKSRKKNVLWHLVGSLWRYAEGYRAQVVLYTFLAVLACGLSLLGPLVMAQLMTAVQHLSGPALENRALELLALFFLVGVAFWACHGPSRVLENTVAFHVKRAFRVSMMEKITALPSRWHRDHHSGQTIDQVAKAAEALGEFSEYSFEVLHLASRFVGSLALLTWFMPAAGLAVLGVTALVIGAIVLFDRTLVRQYEELNQGNNRVAAAVQDYLTNISTVLSLRLEGRVVREVRERIQALFPLYRRNIVTSELKWFTTARLVDASQVGVLLLLIASLARGAHGVEVGTVYAVSEYLRQIGDTFFQFTWKYGVLVMESTRLGAVEHIERAFDEEVRATARAGLPEGWRRLEIRNLQFHHAEGGPGIQLDRLELLRGRRYAFVGESGSGKSTLLGVLRGLHEGTAEVWCDGERLPHGLAHVHHHTTLIPQDPEIFSDSIRFNVTLGLEAAPGRVERALASACFDTVLARLPRGLDTSIAEKGVSLSGGERQRLALARGLFFEEEIDSALVLLDEPTSSVDVRNERRIYHAVLEQCRDRCLISALHKFHLLELFDELVVFAHGRIVERGPLAELRAAGGELARLLEEHEPVRVLVPDARGEHEGGLPPFAGSVLVPDARGEHEGGLPPFAGMAIR